MGDEDVIPKRVVVLLKTYAHQLRREGKSEAFITSVINGLCLDYWTAMEEELEAGKSLRQARSHAFKFLQQNLPSPTTRDPLRKSCLIDADYVMVCLLLGLCCLTIYYFITSVSCQENCIYGFGFWVFKVSPFILVMAIRSMRLQPCGLGTRVRNFWSFLQHFPAELFTNFRHIGKNFALVGLCLCGAFLLGVMASDAFVPVLGLIFSVYVVLPMPPFGCVTIGPLMPPEPMITPMLVGQCWLIFSFAGRFVDYALQLLARTLIHAGLTGYVLRF